MKVPTLITTLIILSCTPGSDIKDGMTFGQVSGSNGQNLTISFERGKNFIQPAKLGVVKLKIRPQMTIWLEDTTGNYLKTLYVTHCFGKQEWRSIKSHPDSCYRTMCMPYWLNRYKAAGNAAPTSGNPLPDAVTGATPTGSFTVNFALPDSFKTGVLFVEWNSSFDNNESFTRETASFNGQPSLILSCRINADSLTSAGSVLTTLGHGGKKGDDGTLYSDVSKLTTAASIFSRVTVARKEI